jgi:ACS family tartrate transporter-like MFS transporter
MSAETGAIAEIQAGASNRLPESDTDGAFTACAWRLIPFLGLLYIVNYLDRVNAGFAALTMNADLGFSPSVFGFGSGVLFLGYLLFQVPANAILTGMGARRWIFFILMVWGLISASTAFVRTASEFYVLRFLLGIAEAGFFPGMMYYLTLWFPQSYRARFAAAIVCAIPLSAIIGGPASGLILDLNGFGGLQGWQWLFILEGLPASLLGFVALFLLPDGPGKAGWLSSGAKAAIAARLEPENPGEKQHVLRCLRDARVLVLAAAGFASGSALYATSLWLPQIVKAMGFSNLGTGIVVSLIYTATMIMIIGWGYSSDRTGERFRHVVLAWLIAAAGFAVAAVAKNNAIALAGLVFAVGAIPAAISPYFTLGTVLARGVAAAGAVAVQNSIVSIGGFAGPWLIGILRERSGSYSSGMTMLAIVLVAGAVLVLWVERIVARQTRIVPCPEEQA